MPSPILQLKKEKVLASSREANYAQEVVSLSRWTASGLQNKPSMAIGERGDCHKSGTRERKPYALWGRSPIVKQHQLAEPDLLPSRGSSTVAHLSCNCPDYKAGQERNLGGGSRRFDVSRLWSLASWRRKLAAVIRSTKLLMKMYLKS